MRKIPEREFSFCDFNMQRPEGGIIDFLQGNFLSADATIILLLLWHGALRDQHFCNKIICFLPKKKKKNIKEENKKDPNVLLQFPRFKWFFQHEFIIVRMFTSLFINFTFFTHPHFNKK